MLLASVVIGALVLITACSLLGNQKSKQALSKLVDVNFGPDYEVQLISGYPELTFYHIKSNDTYVVSTRLRTYESFRWTHYWRVARNGELLGSFATEESKIFSFAGVSFDATSYNDWPLTGDKRDKTYHQIIDSHDINEKTLNKLFSESEQILWNEFNFDKNGSRREGFHFYLKKQNQWSLLISDKKLFNYPQADWPPISHLYINRSTREASLSSMNEGLLDRKQTASLYPSVSLVWTDVRFTPDQPIVDVVKYKGFDSEYSVSPSFMSQNGWKGKIGEGNLQLSFGNKSFDFRTYMREVPHANHSEYDPKIRISHPVSTDAPNDFLLLQFTTQGLGDDRDDKDVGIYILRKKISQEPNTLQPVSQIVFKDFLSAPVIRWVVDASGYRNDWPEKFSATNVNLPTSLKSFPMYLDFYLPVPKIFHDNPKFSLIINEQSWRWESSKSIYATLYLDPEEMKSAVRELGNTDLALTITLEQQEKAIRLVVRLESATKSVHLNNVRLVSKARIT